MTPDVLASFLSGQTRRVHLLGVGGAAMHGLARILHQSGHHVSGCDLVTSPVLDALRQQQIAVWQGHDPAHLEGAELVVYSSAVPENLPELVAARERGVPTIKRAVLQGALSRQKATIAVAGTHGKTTTTAMLAHALHVLGEDPAYLIGGEPRDLPAAAQWSKGTLFALEADEFDRAFLALTPLVAVLTTIEPDHLDVYGDFSHLVQAFRAFLGQVPAAGHVVCNADDPVCRRLGALSARDVRTWSLQRNADWRCVEWSPHPGGGSRATVVGPVGRVHHLALAVPGRHNVQNALACLAALETVGIPSSDVVEALRTFRGVKRRLEVRGQVDDITVIDDYAHHPTEVRASLRALRESHAGRVICVYQPHLRSRTAQLFKEFTTAFAEADILVLLEAYQPPGRGEEGVSSRTLGGAITEPEVVLYAPDTGAAQRAVLHYAQPGDAVIIMGAGDVTALCEPLLAALPRGAEK